jgi:membrane protease YdiL (CAAX protease family)
MNTFIEPLILYAVLFFRFSIGAVPSEEFIEFSATIEIARILLYNIPSLALIWYLLLRDRSIEELGITLPVKRDFISAALTLPALILVGLTISKVSPLFDGISSNSRFLPPQTFVSWVILSFSCLSTGYLEESFFRFYLLSRKEEMGLGPYQAVLFSTLMFSFCHAYEGPWGFLNAAISGVILAFVFLRFRSLHGIAIAHALYNMLVYAMGVI